MHRPSELEMRPVETAADRERSARIRAVGGIEDAGGLTAYLMGERTRLLERLRKPAVQDGGDVVPDGLAAARELSDIMDAVIARMYALACTRSRANSTTLPIVIIATGGYGRRELCPFSDIDITFVPYRDGDPQIDRVIREMFTQLMDICISRCGLEVGYAYRLMEDCGALDHQTLSGLLDARYITGSERLFIQFEDAFWMNFNAADFMFTKLDERRRALEKWGSSPRVVEPQLKEGPGGLRDLQTAVWLAQARNHLAAARVRGDNAFAVLTREAHVSAEDARRLREAKEQLFRVRNALHAAANAARDQLVITRQEEVAAALGYGREDTSDAGEGTPPVERFMAELYPDLALVRRVSGQVLKRMENSRLILGIGLDCKRRQIVPANNALETDDPLWLLWACELAQKYALEFGEDLESAIIDLVQTHPAVNEPQLAAQVFTQILSKIGSVYPILQQMADLGILNWFLPEFGKLMDLIPYDPSHDYTVGQHSLLVVRTLEALRAGTEGEENAEMRRVLESLPHPEQLILTALLHDSGKTVPGRPHSEVSEEIVAEVCARLAWSEEATANVRFLVRCHLVMAETSRLRDLNLEETIRDFTAVVNDIDRLNMLYLLTYADTKAVGEGVWTQVKGRFLRDLWRRAGAVLTDEEPVGYDDAALARARRRLLKDLALDNLPEEEVAEHIRAMPPYYLLNQNLSRIALHMGFVRQVREGRAVIDFHDERDATYTELTVCTVDDPKPGLLAKIARVLYAADLNVYSAEVITRVTEKDRIALDTLWIDYRGRQLSPGKRREITTNLTAALLSGSNPPEIIRKRRGGPANGGDRQPTDSPLLTVYSIRNDLSDTLTVIETGSTEVHGTLYFAADAFSRLGWDIRSARVSSWRGEARASFYVAGVRHLSEAEARRALAGILTPAEPGGVPGLQPSPLTSA